MYGPLWIYITTVVVFLIVGHFQKLVRNSEQADALDDLARKYGFLNPDALSANQSLHKIVLMSFLIGAFFLGVPLAQLLTVKSHSPNG